MKPISRQNSAEAVLLLVTFFWGTTFVIVKQSIEIVPVFWFLFLRFTAAALPLWIFLALRRAIGRTPRPISTANRRALIRSGVALGMFLFISYAFQTVGLTYTSASKSAFITGTNVFWIPMFTVVFLGKRLGARTGAAVTIGLVGLYLLAMAPGQIRIYESETAFGDGLTLVCALAVAIHVILTKWASHRHSTTALTAIQLTTVAACCLVASIAFGEEREFDYPPSSYGAILFLAMAATLFAFWAQTRMQRYTSEERTALIFLFEPVFGGVAGYLVLSERLAGLQWLGAGLILLAVVISEGLLGKASPWSRRPHADLP